MILSRASLLSYVLVLAAGILLLAGPEDVRAQEGYLQFDYMDVPPGQAQTYVDLEKDLWKPIHRQRIEEGRMAEWRLYEVVYPAGTERAYDYVTVTYYEKWSQLENLIPQQLVKRAHPDKETEEILQQTVDARSLVRTDVVELIDSVDPKDREAQIGDYLAVDFMKVPEGGGPDYVQMEQELWTPIHREIIQQGGQVAWHLVGLQFTGASAPYQYMTLRVNDSWDDLAPTSFGKAIEAALSAAHPDTPTSEITERTEKTRDLARSEVWRLVDKVVEGTE